MAGGNRSFLFGLTVSEIAFILFFLLVLISWLELTDILNDKEIAEAALEEADDRAELADQMLATLREGMDTPNEVDLKELFEQLRQGVMSKQKLEKAQADISELTQRVAELGGIEQQLQELQKLLGTDDPDKVQQALEAFSEYAEALAGEELEDMSAAEMMVAIDEKYDDMQGQLENMRYILERQGLGLPPCWPDPNDPTQPDFTFDVFLFANGELSARNISPPNRRDEYARLPGTEIVTSGRISLGRFASAASQIEELGLRNGCVYYVKVDFENADACRYTVDVERFFYKYISIDRTAKCSGLR